jgi:DNA-binding MarR family transcriptional regulator
MTATDPLRSELASDEPRLAYAVGRFHTVLRAEMSRRLAAEGLSVPEFTALSVLSARSGLSNAELARRSFVTPQAMNQVLTSLEEKELIARPAPGEQRRGHHRARGAKLTAKGRRWVTRAQTLVDAIEDQAFAALGEAERRALTRVLGTAAQRLAAGAGPPGR